MDESNGSDNSSRDSIDDRVALMSRKFKQMIKKKGNLQHSSKRKGHKIQEEIQGRKK